MAITEALIIGAVEGVVSSILEQLCTGDPEIAARLKSIDRTLKKQADLQEILQKASAAFAKSLKPGRKQSDNLKAFLVSPDVEAILRQIFSAQLMNASTSTWADIRAEFARSLALFTHESSETADRVADEVFPGLIDACSRSLSAALARGNISPQFLAEVSTNRMLMDELNAIQLNADLLGRGISLSEIHDFERKYRKQIGLATRFIVPPDTEQVRKIPIDDLYVSSDFIPPSKKKTETLRPIGARQLTASSYRTVILGNPGGGKSTFVRKLSHDLAIRYEDRLFAGRRLTPILITLRDYGTEKKLRGCSIIQFLGIKAQSEYQLPTVPPHAFDYLFLNGRALLLFDGLDELLDTTDRQKISQDVELFADLYPAVPIIVTSREVGYEQAPLDDRFQIVKLSPFTAEQTESYVSKWFAVNSDLSGAQRKQKTQAFMKDSQIVSDLRSNPLMLALMCILYRGEGYIPKNRPDVYKRCAEMLFEKWDKGRGIIYTLPFESHIRPAMHYLADWIYSDQRLQGGVSEDALVYEATKYLNKWCFEDIQDAESAARQFIEFCRGRAWVFTDTGTQKGGQRLYQFTHRTFLEYFTAVHMVKTHRTPSDLIALLLPHIRLEEWDNVAQLAFQLQSAGFEGDADELLKGLMFKTESATSSELLNILTFVARALHYLVPTPSIRRMIAQECLSKAIQGVLDRSSPDFAPQKMLGALLSATKENVSTVKEELISVLGVELQSPDMKRAAIAAELAMQLPIFVYFGGDSGDGSDIWSTTAEGLKQTFRNRLLEIAYSDVLVALICVWNDMMSAQQLAAAHGFDAFFVDRSFRLLHGGMAGLGTSLLHAFCADWELDKATEERHDRLLAEIGAALLKSAPPWLGDEDGGNIYFWGIENPSHLGQRKRQPEWTTAARFSACVLLATATEVIESPLAVLDSIVRHASTNVAEIVSMVAARYRKGSRFRDFSIWSLWNAQQQELLSQWVQGSVDFVSRDRKTREIAARQGRGPQALRSKT